MIVESHEYNLTEWDVARGTPSLGRERAAPDEHEEVRPLHVTKGYFWMPCRISQTWMQGACAMNLRALRSAFVLLGLARRRRSQTVAVKPTRLKQEGWHLDPRCLNRGIRDLERHGFVAVEWRTGKALLVTILDPPRNMGIATRSTEKQEKTGVVPPKRTQVHAAPSSQPVPGLYQLAGPLVVSPSPDPAALNTREGRSAAVVAPVVTGGVPIPAVEEKARG